MSFSRRWLKTKGSRWRSVRQDRSREGGVRHGRSAQGALGCRSWRLTFWPLQNLKRRIDTGLSRRRVPHCISVISTKGSLLFEHWIPWPLCFFAAIDDDTMRLLLWTEVIPSFVRHLMVSNSISQNQFDCASLCFRCNILFYGFDIP